MGNLYIGLDIPALPQDISTDYADGSIVCRGIDTTTGLLSAIFSSSSTSIAISGITVAVSTLPAFGAVVDSVDHNFKQRPTVRAGGMKECIAGAAIDPSSEARLVFDTAGRVYPMPSASGTYQICGFAMSKVTTAGDAVDVLIAPQTVTKS